MKVGDSKPVTLAGQVVAQAKVTELGDGTATLVIPATKVVMGVRTELTDLPKQESGTEVIVDEVVRDAPPAVDQSAAAPTQPAGEAGTPNAAVVEPGTASVEPSAAVEPSGESTTSE